MASLPGEKFNVYTPPRVEYEIRVICLRVAKDSPSNAILVLERIERMIDELEYLPRRFPVAPEARRYKRELRHVVVSSFRVIYEVREASVYIAAVRHAARRRANDLEFD